MSDSLSSNLAYLKASETVAISAETKRRRAAGEEIVDLSVGEPDFDTPKLVGEAGITAIQKGYTRYPPNAGIVELRTAIARNLSLMSGGRALNPDQSIAARHSADTNPVVVRNDIVMKNPFHSVETAAPKLKPSVPDMATPNSCRKNSNTGTTVRISIASQISLSPRSPPSRRRQSPCARNCRLIAVTRNRQISSSPQTPDTPPCNPPTGEIPEVESVDIA